MKIGKYEFKSENKIESRFIKFEFTGYAKPEFTNYILISEVEAYYDSSLVQISKTRTWGEIKSKF